LSISHQMSGPLCLACTPPRLTDLGHRSAAIPRLFTNIGSALSWWPLNASARWTRRESGLWGESACRSRNLFAGTQCSTNPPANYARMPPLARRAMSARHSLCSWSSAGGSGGKRWACPMSRMRRRPLGGGKVLVCAAVVVVILSLSPNRGASQILALLMVSAKSQSASSIARRCQADPSRQGAFVPAGQSPQSFQPRREPVHGP
jgi:hypothetical protein